MQGELGDQRTETSMRARLALVLATALSLIGAAAAVVGLAGAPAVAGDDKRLLPDLVTLPIATATQLEIRRDGERARLLLDNTVGNKGEGPLEISASAEDGASSGGVDCEPGDFVARQNVYSDANGSGVFERGGPDGDGDPRLTAFGCMRYHAKPEHNHWHVINFTIYRLLAWRTGETTAEVRKQGFCLLDGNSSFPALPGYEAARYFDGDCGFGNPDEAPPPEGISIGWSDIYTRQLPGQAINITGVPAGRYCLSSKVDPRGKIAETDESNNARLTPIRIVPRKQQVTRLPGTCPRP